MQQQSQSTGEWAISITDVEKNTHSTSEESIKKYVMIAILVIATGMILTFGITCIW